VQATEAPAAPTTIAAATTAPADASTTTAAPAEPTGEPIHIASVITQDSPIISFTAAAKTLEAWVAWVNDTGGINGRPVELSMYDDKLDPVQAREAFGSITGDDSVVALVGAFAPLGIGASLPDVDAAGLPIVPGSGLVLQEFSSPTAYMLVSEPADFGFQACSEAMRRGWDKAALLYLDTAEVRPIIDGYKACADEQGGEVVLDEAVAFGAPSLADTALRVIDSGANVIFLEIDAATTAQLWSELDRQGAVIPSLGNPGIYDDMLRDYPGPSAEGFVMQTSVLPPHLDDDAVHQVQDVVEQYQPGTVLSPVAMSTWAGAELFRTAAEAAGPDLTRASLLAALAGVTDFTAGGLTPPISYGPDDRLGSSAYWFFELHDNQWGPIGPLQEMG
jgi:branched-chain amino acid transport system substrate-binding protein